MTGAIFRHRNVALNTFLQQYIQDFHQFRNHQQSPILTQARRKTSDRQKNNSNLNNTIVFSNDTRGMKRLLTQSSIPQADHVIKKYLGKCSSR